MPVSLEFRGCGVIFWAYGVLAGQEVLEANRAAYGHEFKQALRFQLAINSRVEDCLASPDEERELASMDTEFSSSDPRIVIAVAESDYLYGVLRMWNIQVDSDTFQSFVVRSIDKAREILREHGIELGELDYPANCD
ncbi:MAG: hypothetical protein ACI9BW_002344 [Gammaproteobacteria bacterium]|jgi:hypothetical protein